MQVSGLFEYSVRNFFVTYLRDQELDESELALLDQMYSNNDVTKSNRYTGKYQGKNLIFLQLEGIDSWLLNKTDTPTLYNMLSNSINFSSKHYSFYTGGGSTFNSEFSVNTGFVVPISYTENAYSFSNNNFPYAMAKLFKSDGYTVNAFHMNTKEYYSRSINYDSWGYDHYYGLVDMEEYSDDTYELDRELINNEDFSNLMFPSKEKFVDYIITYSTHLPFTNTSGVCKLLYDLDNEGKEVEFKEMTEEECARRQAKETDYMVELLLQKLEANNLIDNTVIVVFTDHYLYTLNDQSILANYKETDNNLINNTPFFIWDNGKTKKTIKEVTSQLDILPTVLNLFGIKYNKINYIGNDALASSYDGIVFFSDYSWYDGNVYVEGGEVTNKKKISSISLEEKNTLINNLIIRNDLTLKYDYFDILNKK
jgi:phosphoglycerol transferase MdoB-like AlkP superfamily enzyme